MRALLTVLLLAPTANARPWREWCQTLLGETSRARLARLRAAYPKFIDSGPVLHQSGGTCQFTALISHLQAIHGVTLSADYLDVRRLRANVEATLSGARARDLPLLHPSNTCPNLTIDEVARLDGLALARDFRFTREFVKEVASLRAAAAGDDVATMLAERLGEVLARGWATGDVADARTRALDLLDRAEAGLAAGADPAGLTRALIPPTAQLSVLHLRDWVNERVSDQDLKLVRNFLRANFARGHNVILYALMEHGRAEKGGRLRLPEPTGAWRRTLLRSQAGLANLGHAVTIDGYRLDRGGRLRTLLIKDSQGPWRFDGGYLHMDVEYLRLYGLKLVALVPAGDDLTLPR